MSRDGEQEVHELSVSRAVWSRPAERSKIVEALPHGFAPVHVQAGRDVVLLRLGQPRDQCGRCGEPMDEVARWMLVEECSACALELGLLEGAAV